MPGLIRLKQSTLAPLDSSRESTQSLIYRSASARVNWDGIETYKRCLFRHWTPGEEHTEVLTFKNLSGKTIQFTYEVPKTRYFQTIYPRRLTLNQGVTFSLPIQFSPLEKIPYLDELIVYINQTPRRIALAGLLPEYRLVLEPKELQFGYCAIQDIQIRSFQIRNTGDLDLPIDWNVTEPFSIEPRSCSIPVGGRQIFSCSFQPQWALIYVGTATCLYGQSVCELQLHGVGKFPYLVVRSDNGQLDENTGNILVDFSAVPINVSLRRDLVLINQSSFRVPYRIEPVPGVAKFDSAFRFGKSEGVLEAGKKQIIPIKFQAKAYGQFYRDFFNVLTQQGSLVNAVIECSGRALGNAVEITQQRILFGQVLANGKSSRIIELINGQNNNAVRFRILNAPGSPFQFSVQHGTLQSDRSKQTIIVTFSPTYPMGYYKIVPILIEYQAPILLELVGTCHSDSGKPPVLNERYLGNFKRHVARHLALYPFETLTDYLNRGKLALDENGSLIETEEGSSIQDAKTIKDDREYLVPPFSNPLMENNLYWFSTEDHTRFEYFTMSERNFIFDQCSLDMSNEWQQSLTITNLTRGKLVFIWSIPESTDPSSSFFSISPTQAEIPPLKSTAFRLIFRPKTVDTFYHQHFEGYAFYKNQRDFTLVPDYGVMCPVQCDITCLGHTLRPNHEVIPKCQLDRDMVIFPPIAQQTSIYQTLTLTNQGTTPLIYRFISTQDDGNHFFTFKPSHGLIPPDEHAIVLVRYKPLRPSRHDEIHQERFLLRLNEREKFDQIFHVFATEDRARLLIPNEGHLHALTTCVGLTSDTHFQLKSLTRTDLEFQWHLDSNLSSLQIEPLHGSFTSYEEKDFRILYQPKQDERFAMAARLVCWIGDRKKQGTETYHFTIHAATREGFLRAHEQHRELAPIALGTSTTYDLYLNNGSDCLLRYRLSCKQTILSSHQTISQPTEFPPSKDENDVLILDFLTSHSAGRGEIDGKAKLRVPCRIHPFSRSTYQLEVFYELLNDFDQPLSEHIHPLCTLIVHGVYPHLAFPDILGSQQAASLSKNLLSKAFNLTAINNLLAKEPTKEELAYAIHSHRDETSPRPARKVIMDDKQSALDQPEAISFNFNAAPINSAPSEVHLLLENCSDLETPWSFLFPKDLQVELEYWARTGEFTEEELNEIKLQDNKIFTIQPKKGVLAAGSSVTVTLAYKHIFPGQHTLPAIFKVGRSRQIMLNLVGTSVEPGEAYIQFYSTTHHLLPVELGAQGAPVQQYELWNGGTVPIHFQVDMSQLEQIAASNYGFWVLDCLTPDGVLMPNKSFVTQWVFNPLEAREYVFNIKIDLENREPAMITFVGHGFDKRDPTSDMSRTLTDHLAMTKQLNLDDRLACLTIDRIHFGNLPLFTKQRRITFLKNQSHRDAISFIWHVTNPEQVRHIRVQPVRGKILPRQSVPIKVTFMAIEAPAFHDIDLVCEIYNETTMQQYQTDLKRWEATIQEKWERFEIDDEEYEACLRNGAALDEVLPTDHNQYQQSSTLQMCKTLPPVVVNYELDESNVDRARRLRANARKQMSMRPQMPMPELVHLAFTARTLVYNEYLDLCHDTSQLGKFFIDTCLGGDFRQTHVKKSVKANESLNLTGDGNGEQLTVNVEEADMLRSTLSDLLRSLLSDRVFADTLPEMIAETIPFFAQLQYSSTEAEVTPPDTDTARLNAQPSQSSSHEGHLTDRDQSGLWSSLEQDKHISHPQRVLPISSTPSSMFDYDQKGTPEDNEQLKTNPNLTSLAEDVLENTLWNILQEAYHNEFSLTARPRLIALPPKRQGSMLTRANLQQTDAQRAAAAPPPLITTESIE